MIKRTLKKISHILPDSLYIRIKYFVRFHKFPNLKNPKTYNEKLQWLKLHDRKPEYTQMVDKYEAKKYVASIIGEEYIIPTLGVWDKFEDIDFDALPDRFVLKCTHDSGGLVICRDKSKLDIESARKKINASLKENYYWQGREWPYKNVKPRIIAEQYMEDSDSGELRDYKFYCFDGVAKALLVATGRSTGDTRADYFDMDFRHLDFTWGYPNASFTPKRPESFEKMKCAAEQLSKGMAELRVDFYEVDGSVYFGELTFYDGGGMQKITPEEWDEKLGNLIKIPGGGTY